MGPVDWQPGQVVYRTARGQGVDCKATIKRVMKRFVETTDGQKFGIDGHSYPKETWDPYYWRPHTPELERRWKVTRARNLLTGQNLASLTDEEALQVGDAMAKVLLARKNAPVNVHKKVGFGNG